MASDDALSSSSSSTSTIKVQVGGWVEARIHCDHLASLSSDLSHIPTPDTPCARCQCPKENWLCLCCKVVLCSRYVNKHMLEHYRQSNHFLALGYSDLSVWCFPCKAYLNAQLIPELRPVYEKAYILKFGTESSKLSARSSARFRSPAAENAYNDRFHYKTLLPERGVKVSDLVDPTFSFILDIFKNRGWDSLIAKPIRPYIEIVREFYANIHEIKRDPPSFETHLRDIKIKVTSELISKVAKVPTVPKPDYPFPDPKLPSKDTMMKVFASEDGLPWHDYEKNVALAHMTPGMKLLARIVLQNLWPSNHQTEMDLDKAKFMFAIIDGVPIDFCSHAIFVMIDTFHDKVTSLPFAGLITKIAKHKKVSISTSEPCQTPLGFLNKSTVQKSLAQISQRPNRFIAPDVEELHPGTVVDGDTGDASSSTSSVPVFALMEQFSAVLQRLDHLGQKMTDMDQHVSNMREHFGQQLGQLQTDYAADHNRLVQIELDVKTVLQRLIPEEEQDDNEE